MCVFVFFQWQQLYTRQRPIGPDTPFASAKGFRGQTEIQRGTNNSLRRMTTLESATVGAAKSMCVWATAGYPALEAPVSSPGAVAAHFSESRSCSRPGPSNVEQFGKSQSRVAWREPIWWESEDGLGVAPHQARGVSILSAVSAASGGPTS
jgi:hypothetical protein